MILSRPNNAFRAFLSLAATTIATTTTGASAAVNPVEYADASDFALLGYKSVPENAAEGEKFPAVVILPDWSNIDDFEKGQADYVSGDMGYVGFAADLYGPDLHNVEEMATKIQQATMLRSDSDLFTRRIDAAIDTVAAMPEVDPTRIAVIGYCLGGTGVLTYSFANTDPATSKIVAGASFHGGLMDFPIAGEMVGKVLVLSGGSDDAGTAVEDLEASLKAANATWQITRYSGVDHGFAVSTSPAYNEWVAKRSHAEMETFLDEAFSMTMYGSEPPVEGTDYKVVVPGSNGTGAAADESVTVSVQTVDYDQDGFALEGYLAHHLGTEDASMSPGLLILPDWDGVNGPTGYEAERAALAAKEAGMVAMVADIYGKNYTNVEDFPMRIQLSTQYRSDPALFVSRIQTALDVLRADPMVDSDHIYVAGYCLGGTGALDYAFSSGALESVRAVVPIHGGLNPLRAVQTDKVLPHVLILSGGIDDAHGNTTELELQLDGAGATWEITRYSDTPHGFTSWGSDAYNAMADSRSWESMMTLFTDLQAAAASMPMPSMTEEVTEVAPEAVTTEENGDHEAEDHHSEDEDHHSEDHDDGEDEDSDSHNHDHGDEMSMEESSMEDSSAARAIAGLAVAGSAILAGVLV